MYQVTTQDGLVGTVKEGDVALNGTSPVSKIGVVQNTINYKLFKFDKRNRPTDEKHLMRLHDAIEKKNLLREHPILVDPEMNVLDGQNRLKVAMSLKVPIYYIVSERVSIEDVAEISTNTKPWKMEDYFHHWCAAGSLEYLKLRRFCKQYEFLPLGVAVRLCGYAQGGSRQTAAFRVGTWRANDIPFAEQVAQALLDFKEYAPFYAERAFVSTAIALMANSEYDHARMMGKMRYLSSRLIKCPDTDAYFRIINDIYNYKVKSDQQIALRRLSRNDARYRADRKART